MAPSTLSFRSISAVNVLRPVACFMIVGRLGAAIERSRRARHISDGRRYIRGGQSGGVAVMPVGPHSIDRRSARSPACRLRGGPRGASRTDRQTGPAPRSGSDCARLVHVRPGLPGPLFPGGMSTEADLPLQPGRYSDSIGPLYVPDRARLVLFASRDRGARCAASWQTSGRIPSRVGSSYASSASFMPSKQHQCGMSGAQDSVRRERRA